jgi:plasmid stability protein
MVPPGRAAGWVGARPRAVRRTQGWTRDPCYAGPVANLTLVIDDDLLQRARMRALAQGTSVNAVVREMLATYAADERVLHGRRRVAELARASTAGRSGAGRRWTRDELYEDRGR